MPRVSFGGQQWGGEPETWGTIGVWVGYGLQFQMGGRVGLPQKVAFEQRPASGKEGNIQVFGGRVSQAEGIARLRP